MKLTPYLIASAAVIGTAAVLVGSGTAASENANTTTQQLLINQRISQAAVLRSNQSLNYLAPIRTTQTDAANTGKNGVTPLSRVQGSGKGWTTSQIADKAVTGAKIADGTVTNTNLAHPSYYAQVSAGAVLAGGTTGTTVTTSGAGRYQVTFPADVSKCTLSATALAATTTIAAIPTAGQTQKVDVSTDTQPGGGGDFVATNQSFHLIAYC